MADTKVSILLIEDEVSYQRQAEILLGPKGEGYDVTIASNLGDAIKILQARTFDVAIVDLFLPGKAGGTADPQHGLSMLNYLSQLERPPRVVVSTGHTDLASDVAKGIQGVEVIGKAQWTTALRPSIRRLALAQPLEEELWKAGGKMSSVAVDLNGGLKVMLERTKALTNAKIGHILFPAGDALAIFVGTGHESIGFRVPMHDSVTGRVFTEGQLWNVSNVDAPGIPYKSIVGGGMKSELAVPLFEGSKPIGVLNLESDRPSAFDETHERIATTVAELVVVTLRSEKRRQELEATDVLLSSVLNSIEEVQRSILKIGINQLEAQTGSMLLVEGNELKVEASVPEDLAGAPRVGMRFSVDDCVSGFAVKEDRVINVKDVTTEKPYCEVYKPLGKNIRSEIAGPFQVKVGGEEIKGVLNFESPKIAAFTEYDEGLLRALAKQAAIALEKTLLYQKLEEAKKREKMAGIGELSGDLVHRMNSPLSEIRANVQLIQINCEPEIKENNYLSDKLVEIHSIADRAIDMVQQMKEKAHSIVLEQVDVVLAMRAALAGATIPDGVRLTNALDALAGLPKVKATQQLIMVFRNMINNAIAAMPDGGEVSLNAALVGEKWVEVHVSDTGIGIPEEWREEIFNILSVFGKGGKGQGLGLWYSRAYIEACGGELPPPDSAVGVGTKFIVRLPVWSQ